MRVSGCATPSARDCRRRRISFPRWRLCANTSCKAASWSRLRWLQHRYYQPFRQRMLQATTARLLSPMNKAPNYQTLHLSPILHLHRHPARHQYPRQTTATAARHRPPSQAASPLSLRRQPPRTMAKVDDHRSTRTASSRLSTRSR